MLIQLGNSLGGVDGRHQTNNGPTAEIAPGYFLRKFPSDGRHQTNNGPTAEIAPGYFLRKFPSLYKLAVSCSDKQPAQIASDEKWQSIQNL